jgi:hypothetical protein
MIIAVSGVVAAWFGYVMVRDRLADAKYRCRNIGGRCGTIRTEQLGREAIAPCQPGGHGETVVLSSKLSWANGEPLSSVDRKQLADTIERWGKARGRRFHVIVDA